MAKKTTRSLNGKLGERPSMTLANLCWRVHISSWNQHGTLSAMFKSSVIVGVRAVFFAISQGSNSIYIEFIDVLNITAVAATTRSKRKILWIYTTDRGHLALFLSLNFKKKWTKTK